MQGDQHSSNDQRNWESSASQGSPREKQNKYQETRFWRKCERKKKSTFEAPERGFDNSYKNFIQSEHRCRTAKTDKTFDTEGSCFIQSDLDTQMYIHPQEGASSCEFYTSQFTSLMYRSEFYAANI